MSPSAPTVLSELSAELACLGPSAGFAHDPSAVAAALERGTPMPPRRACVKEFTLSKVSHVVQWLSRVPLSATPRTTARQASLSFSISRSLLKLKSTESVTPSNHLSSLYPPAFNLSQHQGLFQCVSFSHQVAKVLEPQHQSFQ